MCKPLLWVCWLWKEWSWRFEQYPLVAFKRKVKLSLKHRSKECVRLSVCRRKKNPKKHPPIATHRKEVKKLWKATNPPRPRAHEPTPAKHWLHGPIAHACCSFTPWLLWTNRQNHRTVLTIILTGVHVCVSFLLVVSQAELYGCFKTLSSGKLVRSNVGY